MFKDEYNFDAVYEAVRNNEELTKAQKEYLETALKDLKELSKAIESTKGEFENSSLGILEKNKKLINKSDSILTYLNTLIEILEKEKVNFDKDIQNKLNNLISSVQDDLSDFEKMIKIKNENISNQFEDTKKIIEDNKKDLSKLNNNLSNDFNKSLNDIKKDIKTKKEEFDEFIDEIQSDIKKQSLIGRFGGFVGIFVAGVIVGGLGSLFWAVPVLKHQITANKFLNKITSCDNEECMINYNEYEYNLSKNKNSLIYQLPLKP